MIWLSWRQHRMQAATTVAFVSVLVALLVLVAGRVHATFVDSGLETCVTTSSSAACEGLERLFNARHGSLQFLLILVLFCPLLLGVFWGAPLLARELEQGTHRFAWTQSITRLRWLAPKLGLSIVVVAAAAGAVAAASSWLSHPFNEVYSARLSYGVFDVQGIAPVAYTVFAVALGAAAGSLLRRALPAMAATAAGFIGVRAVVEFGVRPRVLPTREVSYPTGGGRPAALRGDFVIAERVFTSSGELFSSGFDINIGPSTVERWCPDMVTPQLPSIETIDACVNSLGLRTVETIHPASQFWTLQLIEAAVFTGLAVALVLYTAWRVRHRLGA